MIERDIDLNNTWSWGLLLEDDWGLWGSWGLQQVDLDSLWLLWGSWGWGYISKILKDWSNRWILMAYLGHSSCFVAEQSVVVELGQLGLGLIKLSEIY